MYWGRAIPASVARYKTSYASGGYDPDFVTLGLHLKHPRVSIRHVTVHALPSGAMPLTSHWVQYLLHYGRDFSDHIDNPSPGHDINWDWFASVGGEAGYKPYIGASLAEHRNHLVWTPLFEEDGQWSISKDGDVNINVYNNYVDYYALAVYSPYAQTVTMSFRHDDALKVYNDGAVVYFSPIWDSGHIMHSSPFQVTAGWHQMLFKLDDEGGGNYMSIKFNA